MSNFITLSIPQEICNSARNNTLIANTNGGRLTVVGTAMSQNSTTVTVNSSNALVYGDASNENSPSSSIYK